MMAFSRRLREIRTKAGESRQEQGEYLGVSTSQISEMENGRKGTTMERLILICKHYNVSADYLLGLTDESSPLKEENI